jgi:ATP-dependent exoDNAse (exonuclease V) alpha subunit
MVDEAGMVGTRHLGRLNDLAAASGAKLVLIGDHRQLPEILAGGAFAALADRLDPVELHANRRQHQPWERAALDHLRDGVPAVAVGVYRRRGRLTVAETADELREVLVGDWWTAWTTDGPASAIMVALRVSDVADLNARARSRMAATSRLVGPAVTSATELSFQAGDRVVLRRGQALALTAGGVARLENGHRGTVASVDPSRRELVMRVDGRWSVTVPTWYLDAGHLDHGYAITGHRAQGLTTERCYVLGSDALYREWGYTAMSRGRTTNNLYIVTADPEDIDNPVDGHGVQPDERHPVAQLASWMTRSKAQQLALDLSDDEAEHDLAG